MHVLRYRPNPPSEGVELYNYLLKDDYENFCLCYEKYGMSKFYNYHDTLIVTATDNAKLPLSIEVLNGLRKYIDYFLEKKPSVQLISLLIAHGESAKAIHYIDVLIKESSSFTITQTHTLLSAAVANKDLGVFQYLFNSALYVKEHLIHTAFTSNFVDAYEWLLETKQLTSPLLLIEIFCEDVQDCADRRKVFNIDKYFNALRQFQLNQEKMAIVLNSYGINYNSTVSGKKLDIISFAEDMASLGESNEDKKITKWHKRFYYPFEFCKNWDLEDGLQYKQKAQYLYLSICLYKENTEIKKSSMNSKI